jgi:hypothetical protein
VVASLLADHVPFTTLKVFPIKIGSAFALEISCKHSEPDLGQPELQCPRYLHASQLSERDGRFGQLTIAKVKSAAEMLYHLNAYEVSSHTIALARGVYVRVRKS